MQPFTMSVFRRIVGAALIVCFIPGSALAKSLSVHVVAPFSLEPGGSAELSVVRLRPDIGKVPFYIACLLDSSGGVVDASIVPVHVGAIGSVSLEYEEDDTSSSESSLLDGDKFYAMLIGQAGSREAPEREVSVSVVINVNPATPPVEIPPNLTSLLVLDDAPSPLSTSACIDKAAQGQ